MTGTNYQMIWSTASADFRIAIPMSEAGQGRSRFAGFNGEEFVSADHSIAAMVSEREFIHTMCQIQTHAAQQKSVIV